ncbi:MAG: methionyl-tRNA formyltransferase [Sphingobium sp.]|nr:methionyl-tRNA formyltransferase [Sphingobium sp.]MBP6112258.1 methionyl-tRNA formyltransferase [Sphingobium sp.]MBP8670663.1 methionyl-tRNA formyltransferase [Sphingobium sp.]MBP9156869.1 methionyl-tRNA formyltransferase [Sphingobium sp.]MCC6480857.1 methionyl-tRNA formyltransferase [Sphingomonadaceae bacterium]
MKIIYMGTPDFAVPALAALGAAGHEVVAVYSQPPRPAGRGKALRPSPTHQQAEVMGITVRTPVSLKNAEEQAAFAAWQADVAVVAAYGLILPQAILDAPKYGCLNIHGSLLPRWRGAAPVQRAILAGDAQTGVQVMQMEAGLDTGPVRATARTGIDGKTAGELTDELARMGARLIVEVLDDLAAFPPVPQAADDITYAAKITKEEARIDCAAGALQAERQVRAFNPAPGAFFLIGAERIRVLAADGVAQPGEPGVVLDDRLTIGCGADSIRPTRLQRAGREAMSVDELLRGFPIPPGTRLS